MFEFIFYDKIFFMDYKTIANDGIVEEEIKKSRFICHLKRIISEEEGREYIAQIKKKSITRLITLALQ